jgi:hypothetical protein
LHISIRCFTLVSHQSALSDILESSKKIICHSARVIDTPAQKPLAATNYFDRSDNCNTNQTIPTRTDILLLKSNPFWSLQR